LDVNENKLDLISMSSHKVKIILLKIYGPKGIGALYLRRKPKVRLLPLINGGG